MPSPTCIHTNCFQASLPVYMPLAHFFILLLCCLLGLPLLVGPWVTFLFCLTVPEYIYCNFLYKRWLAERGGQLLDRSLFRMRTCARFRF